MVDDIKQANKWVPRYIQEIYIWALTLNNPLNDKTMSDNECVHIIELANGELFIIDVHSIYDFIKDYLIDM